MNMKLFTTAFAVTLTSGALFAQDMGTTVPAQIPAEPIDGDGGLAIVAAAAEAAPQMTSTPPVEEFVTAETLVMNNLDKIDKGIGYDPETDAIIVIGEASIKVNDPATDPNFNLYRESKAVEAYLSAKAEIIRAISTEFKSIEYSRLVALAQEDATANAYIASHKALDEKRNQLAERLKQLNEAEANNVKGVTLGDRFCALLDGVIKKLDTDYNSGKITDEKKQACEQLKAECEQLKQEYATLEEKARSIPQEPKNESGSAISMMAKMPLLGASVLTQAESWDKTEKKYSVAMAVVWSPKLQENAVSLVVNSSSVDNKVGKYSPREWIKRQHLESMVGSRRFNDNRGHCIFVGVSSADLVGPIVDQKAKKLLADTRAIQAVAFALTGDVEAYREAESGLKEYSDDNRVSKEKISENVFAKCDIKLKGCMQLDRREVIHPISGRKIYVSAYYIDPALNKNSRDLMSKAYAGLKLQVAATQYDRGVQVGMQKEIEDQIKSTTEFNRGVVEGRNEVNKEVTNQKNASITPKVEGAKSVLQANPGKSTGGAFSGDEDIDADF